MLAECQEWEAVCRAVQGASGGSGDRRQVLRQFCCWRGCLRVRIECNKAQLKEHLQQRRALEGPRVTAGPVLAAWKLAHDPEDPLPTASWL